MKKLTLILVVFILAFRIAPMLYAGEGHDAGREWAEKNDITDADYNESKSESFNEGVREYAEERAEEADEDSDEGGEASD